MAGGGHGLELNSARRPAALRGGDLQVDRVEPEGSPEPFIDLAPDPVVSLKRPLCLLAAAGIEHLRPTVSGGSERLAAYGARADAYLRIVADALDLGDVCLAANVELPVA